MLDTLSQNKTLTLVASFATLQAVRGGGGIGIRSRLKICRPYGLVGSSPTRPIHDLQEPAIVTRRWFFVSMGPALIVKK